MRAALRWVFGLLLMSTIHASGQTNASLALLQWAPPIEDTIVRDGTLSDPVSLTYCLQPGQCLQLARFESGQRVIRWILSPKHRYAFVWYQDSSGRPFVAAYDTSHGLLSGWCELDESLAIRPAAALLRATPGENAFLSWSAGTNLAEAILCSGQGRVLLALSAAGLELSLDSRYAATFPSLGTPAVVPREVRIYDLMTGKEVTTRNTGLPPGEVISVTWKQETVILTFGVSIDGISSRTDLALPLPLSRCKECAHANE